VADTHAPLVITKRGKPVAKLVPIGDEAPKSMFGYMKGTVTVLGDIIDVPHEPLPTETRDEDDPHGGLPPGRGHES
jgi:antitoxin (DNA-binding transcriptional repressor) of toxin-antitoxin stability system